MKSAKRKTMEDNKGNRQTDLNPKSALDKISLGYKKGKFDQHKGYMDFYFMIKEVSEYFNI